MVKEKPPVKLGFFFGAGAEICLGLPNGGEFALSLFNRNTASLKDQFKKALGEIIDNKNTTQSYKDWLAYKNKISSFTENDFKTVITSSAEHKKEAIINFFQEIDDEAKKLYLFLNKEQTDNDTCNELYSELTVKLGLDKKNSANKIEVKVNEIFSQTKSFSKFFNSKTFTLMIACMRLADTDTEEEPNDQNQANNLTQGQLTISKGASQRLVSSFQVILYMLTVTCGMDVVKKLDSGICSSEDTKLQEQFDKVCPSFNMDLSGAAKSVYAFIREKQPSMVEANDVVDRFSILLSNLSYRLCAKAIDYQMLVDSLFSYIETPKIHWTKFTKIMLFLQTAYDVITESNHLLTIDKLKAAESYYKDIIKELQNDISILQIKGLGSSNYNDYYGKLVKGLNEGMNDKELKQRFGSLSRLNGGVGQFYNPYKNSLIIIEEDEFKAEAKATDGNQDAEPRNNRFLFKNQLITPFFFTQSGTKPMTSIDISCRYADLYRNYQGADAIVVIGFNFNQDDSHINTIFRDLVENQGKHLFKLSVDSYDLDRQVKEICTNLRIDDIEAMKRVHLVPIDSKNRSLKTDSGQSQLWLDYIIEYCKSSSIS